MKYKVGDKVKIRDDLEIDGEYGGEIFVDYMDIFSGKQATITEIEDSEYLIDLDEGEFIWTDKMFVDEVFKVEYENCVKHIETLELLLDKAISRTIRQYQEMHQELNELRKLIINNQN